MFEHARLEADPPIGEDENGFNRIYWISLWLSAEWEHKATVLLAREIVFLSAPFTLPNNTAVPTGVLLQFLHSSDETLIQTVQLSEQSSLLSSEER